MCLLCTTTPGDQQFAQRAKILDLLALVENPEALPADVAFRLAREVLRLSQTLRTELRCEQVPTPEPEIQHVR